MFDYFSDNGGLTHMWAYVRCFVSAEHRASSDAFFPACLKKRESCDRIRFTSRSGLSSGHRTRDDGSFVIVEGLIIQEPPSFFTISPIYEKDILLMPEDVLLLRF